jgi:peptidoglycan/LPS O-acetylase OafA/YrhL
VRLVGWFLSVVGVAIGTLWVVLLATGQVPEVTEGRADIWFHVAAELAAAALLAAAGVSLLRGRRRGRLLAGMAVGALGYTTINSAGYYAEAGDRVPVLLFGLLLVLTVLAAVRLTRHEAAGTTAEPSQPPGSARQDDEEAVAQLSGASREGARDER